MFSTRPGLPETVQHGDGRARAGAVGRDDQRERYHAMGDLEAHGRVDVFANLLESDIERLHILITATPN